MARISEAVIEKDKVFATHSPALNLTYGGQHGYISRPGFRKGNERFDEWISNHAYVKVPVIPILLDYPKFFDLLKGEADIWKKNLKSLVELHALSIEGLSTGLTVDFDEHAFGKAGEMQEEVLNVTRNRSTLTFNFKEKGGKSIQKFLDFYIRYGMKDPDTKRALIANQLTDADVQEIGIYTPDYYTMTMLFIEPDILNKNVMDAWLCTNMMPKSNGERTGHRSENGAGALLDLSIEFTCITMNNEAVLDFADGILKSLNEGILSKIPDNDMSLPKAGIEPTLLKDRTGFDRTDS